MIKTCKRKKYYKSKDGAYIKNQIVYKCKICKGWHRTGRLYRFIKENNF